ncbi:hypothetical protein [Methanolapillus millepedarum]|uniref:Dna2/Cas4 domain-containing protein n=1 Tax=Methanolapillus millepedarum TaxID=3028296 RepID=A0AA96ZW28_9EURY|nr:hypothetical protein MsAc7_10290 [Methanosarcinaceae archaeon Ac7]
MTQNKNSQDSVIEETQTYCFEKKQTYTTVSDIRSWSICPRLFFFNDSSPKNKKRRNENDGNDKNGGDDEISNSFLFQKDPVHYFESEFLREMCFFLPEMVISAAQENENGDILDFRKLEKDIKQLADDLKEEMKLWIPKKTDSNAELAKTKPADEIYSFSEKPVWDNLLQGKQNPVFLSAIVAENADFGYSTSFESSKPVEKISPKNESAIDEAYENTIRQIPELVQNVSKTIESHGFSIYEAAANPIHTKALFYFEKLNLSGAPHKIIVLDNKILPYLIKTSKAPQNGIWEKDKIAAAAYVLLLENKFGKTNVFGNFAVDYAGEIRIGRTRLEDKKAVFRILRQMKETKNGKMPNARNIRFCDHCDYKEKCRPKLTSFFSKLFG